ncbi:MAG: radical SAM protein [Desulfobacterales bacterium]|nr:radical SAM protein [Desulfobacterales bacterium]
MTDRHTHTPVPCPPLRSIYFYPTQSCNLRCIHCWIKPEHVADSRAYHQVNRDNISVNLMETVVAQAVDLGLVNIKLTGGEPFVCPEIFDYLDCFSKYGLSFTIETNATLLTTAKIKKLKAYNIRLLSTSLDGSGPRVHDRIRGVPGSFERTATAITALVQHQIFPQVIFCLQRANAHDLEATIQVARKLGIKSFEINPLALSGNLVASDSDCQALALEQLLDLNRRVETIFPEKFPDIRVNLYIPPALKGIRSLATTNLKACAIFNICGILANGDVSLCGIASTRKELVAGNVKTQSLKEIWEKAEIFQRIRKKIPGGLEGVCSRCLFRHHCLGFCRADVLAEGRPVTAALSMCQEAFEKGLFPETRILD